MDQRNVRRRKADQLEDRLRMTERVLLLVTGVAIGAMVTNLWLLAS